MVRTASARLALLAAPALLLVACSGDSEVAVPTSSPPAATSPAPGPSGSESPSGAPETILAVLCDSASEESVAALESKLLPDYTLSQVVDVRTDDAGKHALVGFVEGPGVAVLAQWTGTGLGLDGLAPTDEFAAQVTGLPQATPDQETQDLLSQTLSCYKAIHLSEDDKGKDKKKKKSDESAE